MSTEIVTPAFDVIDKMVRDSVKTTEIKTRDGVVKGEITVLHKTAIDKIYSECGIPSGVVKAVNDTNSKIVDSMATIVSEKMVKKLEEDKAQGKPIEELRTTSSQGRIAFIGGSAKVNASAYAVHPNPRDPQGPKSETACAVVVRISSCYDVRHIAKSPLADRARKALEMAALPK